MLTSSLDRVIFVALTNILLITALVSLVSNSLTEVSDTHMWCNMKGHSATGHIRPHKRGLVSACGATKSTKKAPAQLRLFQISQ